MRQHGNQRQQRGQRLNIENFAAGGQRAENPGASTQARKKITTCTPGAPSHSPHRQAAARKPLYKPWLAASTRVCRAKSALRLKARRRGRSSEELLSTRCEMNNSDQRNEESG